MKKHIVKEKHCSVQKQNLKQTVYKVLKIYKKGTDPPQQLQGVNQLSWRWQQEPHSA